MELIDKCKKENKPMKVVEIVLLCISVVVFIFAMTKITGIDSGMLNIYLCWTYILIAIALIFTLGFPLVKAFKNKKSLIKLIALIVAAVVIVGGAYAIAPGSALTNSTAVADGSTLKFTDACLYVCYLFVAAAFVALVWSGVRKSIKK